MNRRRLASAGLAVVAAAALAVVPLRSQQPSEAQSPALRVTAKLVVVDAVVTDKDGRLVRNLGADAFTVLENGKPQRVATFLPPQAAQQAQPNLPELPENIFTNRPAYLLPPGSRTFLLIDTLNTPVQDQAYARTQLLKYVSTQLQGGERIAVLVLGQSLRVLQDFTDDPALLRAAIAAFDPSQPGGLTVEDVESKLPSFRNFSDRRGEVNATRAQQLVGNLRDFLTEQAQVATDVRVARTLAAFEILGRAGAGLPGVKNLIWVSAGFPIVTTGKVIAYSAVAGGDRGQVYADKSYEEQVRRTAAALADAQLAIYPVDARGLVGSLLADASTTGLDDTGFLRTGESYASEVRRAGGALLDTQQTMDRVARETGGRVFTNANDIDRSVAISVGEASANYVLAYTPSDTKWDGKFRKIEVRVNCADCTVRHRSGYYATGFTDAKESKEEKKEREAELVSAMAVGMPPSTAVVMDARALPPSGSGKRKVPVEFLVDPTTLAPETTRDGGGRYDLSFHVAAYGADGKLAASRDVNVNAPLNAENFTAVRQSGFPFRTEIELGPGRYRLRLAVRDNRSGLLGSLEGSLVLP